MLRYLRGSIVLQGGSLPYLKEKGGDANGNI